ncbi:MAG: hypothetical protein ACOC6C_02860 [Verrucomicrobiota bacterium]
MAELTFHCPNCKQKLEAPDDMAGETVECPSCQTEITIPAGKPRDQLNLADISISGEPVADSGQEEIRDEPGEELQDEGNKCPNCNEPMESGAVLCVKCGYHQKIGKVIETDLS